MLSLGADKPPDLTRASPDSFKAHLEKTVTLSGRLEEGMQGFILVGATRTNIAFYIVPETSVSGSDSNPSSWERFRHQQVRVTGELRFRVFNHANKDPLMQVPGDYYYMVLQCTHIERLEKK